MAASSSEAGHAGQSTFSNRTCPSRWTRPGAKGTSPSSSVLTSCCILNCCRQLAATTEAVEGSTGVLAPAMRRGKCQRHASGAGGYARWNLPLPRHECKTPPTTHRGGNKPGCLRVPSYFPPFSFAHRAATAFLAISVRCAGEGFAARALPL